MMVLPLRMFLQGLAATDNLPDLLSIIAASNAALRWLLLHSAGPQLSKVSAAVAKQDIDKGKLCKLMLDTAYLEAWVRHYRPSSSERTLCMRCLAKPAMGWTEGVLHELPVTGLFANRQQPRIGLAPPPPPLSPSVFPLPDRSDQRQCP